MEATKLGCNPVCPACPHRIFMIDESLAQKQQWLMKKLGSFSNCIKPIKGVNESARWHYRNKVCLSVAYDGIDWLFGVNKNHEIIPIHTCPVHSEEVNRNIGLLADILPPPDRFPLAYFLQSGSQVTLVVKASTLPDLAWLTPEVVASLQQNNVDGMWIHLHPSAGRKVIGKGGWKLLFGNPRSINKMGLFYGPSSFSQGDSIKFFTPPLA